MNRGVLLIVVLAALLAISGGIYAYTYTTGMGVISITTPTGDIATANVSASPPDWSDVLITDSDTETLRPNAAGTYSQCEAIGDSPNYACVDEEVSDNDTTNVRTRFGATEIDTYNIPNHVEGTGNVTQVTVYLMSRGTIGDLRHAVETVIRTYGTNYFGTYTLLPTSYTGVSSVNTTNPNTGNPWTWTEIDALEIGVRQYDNGGGNCQTTQVWTDVDYDYLPTTGSVPTGDLFEVYENPGYSGDLAVRVYLANTGALKKAYESLDMRLYLEDSVEAGQTPNYQELTLDSGVASFTLKDPVSDNHTLSVTGGSYVLVSENMSDWEAGWTVTPELYCEATQR